MSTIAESIAAAREAFIEELCVRGFSLRDDCHTLVGDIDVGGSPVQHQILLSDNFPITRPRVLAPESENGPSWHQERDGGLCLWSDEEVSDLPWTDVDCVIERVSQWHAASAAGWPDEPPDLDLERYWPRDRSKLFMYPDLEPLTGKPCKAQKKLKGQSNIWEVSEGNAPRKQRFFSVAVIDLGELDRPVRSFDEIAGLLGDDEAANIRAGIEGNRVKALMVRYRRGGHEAAVGLVVEKSDPEQLYAVRAAHMGDSTLRLRAGLDAEALASKSAAIVGMGAIGSIVAELLARSGIGALTLVDDDLVMPGNCIRHVATHEAVGRAKPEAVKDHLVKRGITTEEAITPLNASLESVDNAEWIFGNHDIVIDATGNGPATALICTASKILGKPSITVCLQRNGTVARVDRFPLGDGEAHDDPLPPGGPRVELREAGCGDPVSPAPPWACAAAAARAAGMAADLLSGRSTCPPTMIDELIREPGSASVAGATH
ncbi:HesA/MoeB/ThiF family protein [Candidatus Poriferisocius sp.]|uniref:HesA/MoeB/ThiF family protein n=1 Tax=Candidatus Poriferisocius sp. TaxID=3101276 RepID=UPI003B02B064